MMDQKQVILQFRFPTFGDSMLQKMNLLRLQRRFCDVTVHVNELEVPGHKVVLAAGSSFLRDQFVLQQESGEVQISMSQEAEVGRRLLLSCYTGQLEFPELELVHYLTVASFLQMGHIVEQCTQALDKFIKPPRPSQHPLLEAEEDNTGLDTGRMREESERRRRRRKKKENEEEGGFSSRPSCQQEQECSSQTHTVYQDEKVEQVEDDDCDDCDEDDDDDDVIIQPKTPPPPPPTQSLRCIRRDAADSGITIVKVESVNDVASESSISAGHFLPSRSSSPPATTALHSPEQPQHSLINSTVDVTRAGDMAALPPHMSSSFPLSPAPPASPPPPPLGKQGGGGHPSGHPRGYDKPLQWYHQCPKCARVFRQLENYANHLKMHKLFMCLLCGKTFTQKGNLHRHMRVHAGIKPFQCKICGKTFTQKCSLLDHLNLHSGDKPHRCNYCDMVFAHKPVLRKHLKQIHGKTSFDNANERSGLHDGGGGGLEFEFGQAKPLCGLTPVRAPPTSHQVQSCSHQAQDLCVAPDSQHQTLHSGVVDS